jgi:hypothetical protein
MDRSILRRRPSAALIVAMVALIAAVSGVAAADDHSQPGGPDGTNGVFKLRGTAAGNTATVLRSGPFTIVMTCTKDVNGTGLTISAASSEPNSVIAGFLVPTAGTQQGLFSGQVAPTTGFSESTPNVWDFETPSGRSEVVQGATGVNSLNADCWVNLTGGAGH